MPSASVDAGTFHCRASGHAGTLPITSASPVRRNGGTWASATPSDASVAQSAIAPSASSVALTGAASRLAPPEAPQHEERRADRRRLGQAGCALDPRRPFDRLAVAASLPGLLLHAGGPFAATRQVGVDRRQPPLHHLGRRLLGVRLEHRRELLDRGIRLAQARDRER